MNRALMSRSRTTQRRAKLAWTLGATILLAAGSAAADDDTEPEAPPSYAGRTLSVQEAVQIALAGNPSLLARHANARGQTDLEKSARGRMLPSVHFFDEGQHWNSEFDIAFAIPSSSGMPVAPIPFKVRDANTNTLTVSADQPLLGLAHLEYERKAQSLAAEAARADIEAARADVKEQVEGGFLSLFEAKALEDIAKASEAELAEQVTVTKARVAAGVLTNADALRVQVAVANAKQQEILAHTQGEVARARLLGVLGIPTTEDSVQFAEPTTLLAQARAALPPLREAESTASQARPELKQLHLQIEAAEHTRKARMWLLAPDVDAEAGYNRLDGQIFAPTNAEYVGFKVNWNIWDWGATWYAAHAAEQQANSVRYSLQDRSNQIGVEVASDLAQARSAANAVSVAQDTIASAEEAFRVTQALLKAGSATTTDLLDAQAALTQARLNLTRAEYEQAMAQVTLARGMGK
jgi:outer membrane protein TolC